MAGLTRSRLDRGGCSHVNIGRTFTDDYQIAIALFDQPVDIGLRGNTAIHDHMLASLPDYEQLPGRMLRKSRSL